MTTTFTSYSDKTSAKRGFTRTYKEFNGNVDDYLEKVDGRWGFSKDADGNPVSTKVAPAVEASTEVQEQAIVSTPYKVVWPGTEAKDTKQEPDAEEEEESAEQAAKASNAFAAFANSQLGSGTKPALPAYSRPPVEPKLGRTREENNGVKRPSEGTICAHVWSLATQITAEKVAPAIATLFEVITAAEAAGVNKFTARTQYARWRVFNGHTGKK